MVELIAIELENLRKVVTGRKKEGGYVLLISDYCIRRQIRRCHEVGAKQLDVAAVIETAINER